MSELVNRNHCAIHLRPCASFETDGKRLERVNGSWVPAYPLFVLPVDEWAAVYGWQICDVSLPQQQRWVRKRKKQKLSASRLRQLEELTQQHELSHGVY
jgi:hypothetical protein